MSESSVPVPRPSETPLDIAIESLDRIIGRMIFQRDPASVEAFDALQTIQKFALEAGVADATYWRDKAKHMAALMAMAGATLCEPVSTANIRDAKKSCELGVHVMREIMQDEKRVPSSEEAANSDTDRLDFLSQQAAAVMGSGGNGGTAVSVLPVSENAPGIYGYSRLGDGWTEEITKNDLREAIDAAMSAARIQGENGQ